MRIRFVVMSVFMGCLSLLLAPGSGRTQFPGFPRGSPPRQGEGNGPRTLPGMTSPRVPFNSSGVPFLRRDPFAWADGRFLPLDRNGDGLLNYEEMTENLKGEREKWDSNKDGQIDPGEWREYVKAFTERRRSETPNPGTRLQGNVRPPPGVRRMGGVSVPKVPAYKKGAESSPSNPSEFLPGWLRGCDTNGDGQVTLYEWKARNGIVSEFRGLDLNGDGFVTIEELIRTGHLPPDAGDPTQASQSLPPGVTAMPDPGSMGAFRGQVGKVLYFEVTGRLSGPVWGTDIYTDDSRVATAAVHAGVLQAGQTGVVKVTTMPGQASYTGSTRNGTNSSNYGSWNSSYRIQAVRRTRPSVGR